MDQANNLENQDSALAKEPAFEDEYVDDLNNQNSPVDRPSHPQTHDERRSDRDEGDFNGNQDAGSRHRDEGDNQRERGGSRSRSRSPRSNSREAYVDIRDSNPETFTQIHISKLDRKTGYSDIEREFSKFGKIDTITLKTHYAFVKFDDHSAACAAIE